MPRAVSGPSRRPSNSGDLEGSGVLWDPGSFEIMQTPRQCSALSDQGLQQVPGPEALLATGELACDEIGHARAGQRRDLAGDLVFVADDGHVGRAQGALAVEHRPV